MSFVVRTKDHYLRDAYLRVGLVPPETETPSWMHLVRGWHPATQRRVEICSFLPAIKDATPFPSAAAAWQAFERTGYGRREDFVVETL